MAKDPDIAQLRTKADKYRMLARWIIAWSVKQSANLKEVAAHKTVDDVKRALRERGPVWWKDGSPDFNRHTAKNTPYSLGTQRSGGTAPEEFECRKPRFSTSTVRC